MRPKLSSGIHERAMRGYVTPTRGQWDEAWQRRYCAEHRHESREVILLDGKLAGVLDLDGRDGHLWVGTISRLIRDSWARASARLSYKRSRQMRLQVLKVNPAGRLYQWLGFGVTGETETHYQMAWSDQPVHD